MGAENDDAEVTEVHKEMFRRLGIAAEDVVVTACTFRGVKVGVLAAMQVTGMAEPGKALMRLMPVAILTDEVFLDAFAHELLGPGGRRLSKPVMYTADPNEKPA